MKSVVFTVLFIFISIGAFITALPACSERDYSSKPVVIPILPGRLKDCTFDKVWSKSDGYIVIVRCPYSTTTAKYMQGKAVRVTSTIS